MNAKKSIKAQIEDQKKTNQEILRESCFFLVQNEKNFHKLYAYCVTQLWLMNFWVLNTSAEDKRSAHYLD